jgi:hypothetical protein
MAMPPSLSAADKEAMKQYYRAARSWDRQRRTRIAAEPNDAATNGRILDTLIEHAIATGATVVDDAREDDAESRLAHVLSRTAHPPDR